MVTRAVAFQTSCTQITHQTVRCLHPGDKSVKAGICNKQHRWSITKEHVQQTADSWNEGCPGLAHLNMVSMGTSRVGLPNRFIIKPCLPLVARTRNRERNIFRKPRCSCTYRPDLCRHKSTVMGQCKLCSARQVLRPSSPLQVCSVCVLHAKITCKCFGSSWVLSTSQDSYSFMASLHCYQLQTNFDHLGFGHALQHGLYLLLETGHQQLLQGHYLVQCISQQLKTFQHQYALLQGAYTQVSCVENACTCHNLVCLCWLLKRPCTNVPPCETGIQEGGKLVHMLQGQGSG